MEAAYRELCAEFPAQCESIRDEAHRFAREIMRPAAMKIDRMADPHSVVSDDSPLWPALKAAYGLGYHRAALPRKFGGLGLPPVGLHAVLEELGWGSAGIALGLMASSFPAIAVVADGRPEMIKRFVKPFAANRDASWIGCWALSEPRHGSDHFMVGTDEFRYPSVSGQLVARADGQSYILDGFKASWVTNGGIATHALCSVAIEPSKAARGFLMIPLDLPGISRGEPTAKIGQREMNQGSIVFENVKVPRNLMLKGEGYEHDVTRLLALAHSSMAAIMTGTARAAYEEALDHSKRRDQGGRRISEHQLIQKSLFEMFSEVEACRAFSRATLIYNWAGTNPSMEGAIAAKTFCTRTAFDVANRAIQIFGADGLSTGNLIEKLFRDARVSLIEQGVNEALEIAGARQIIQ
jgi:alkylation response protein AidB-like acyl-CoA dehydrogenase